MRQRTEAGRQALRAIQQGRRVEPRRYVALVHAAAGGVGQLLVQSVKARGGAVVATAGTPEKCATASELGADHGEHGALDAVCLGPLQL